MYLGLTKQQHIKKSIKKRRRRATEKKKKLRLNRGKQKIRRNKCKKQKYTLNGSRYNEIHYKNKR